MIKVAHIVTGLAADGAERMLYNVATSLEREGVHAEVISLTGMGQLGPQIEARGITVRRLEMGRGVPNPLLVFRLAGWLRKSRPDVVQTWMYHADLVGGLAARLSNIRHVVWGIHHSNLERGQNRTRTIWTARACARLSWSLPARIICCSESARRLHAQIGYDGEKTEVIPNGIDTDLFCPDRTAGVSVRRELGIPLTAPVIGMAARFHIQKDHRNFVEAAARLSRVMPEVHYVLCGNGMTWENTSLRGWLQEAGIVSQTHLLGIRGDMPRVFAGMNLAASSSLSEALPVAVGEAMACGLPCAVTDAGDSALLVNGTGMVVPPRDPAALAKSWQDLLSISEEARRDRGMAARRRIESCFNLRMVMQRYRDLYLGLAGGNG
jgi:glycosyltransferase involved in cell wall biosynthesis